MPAKPEQLLPALSDQDQRLRAELVVVHLTAVLDAAKGFRITVRIQDGWQGATLSHWSLGGKQLELAPSKGQDNARIALDEALGYVELF